MELTEAFLAKIAGWEAMKLARSLCEGGQVLSSNWTPPLLKGVVQEGSISYRAGLVVKDSIDLENICSCRASRQWGTICAHSVAVGLHHLQRDKAPSPGAARSAPSATGSPSIRRGVFVVNETAPRPAASGRRLLRAGSEDSGEAAELFVIFPPNLPETLARGKIMICLEASWKRGRSPLNALPLTVAFAFSVADAALLDQLETRAAGEIPAMLMLTSADLTALLGVLIDHPRLTLGRGRTVTVGASPWRVPWRATLRPSGEIQLQIAPSGKKPALIPGERNWVYGDHQFQPVDLPANGAQVWQGPVELARSQVPQFLSQVWPALQASGEVRSNFHLEDFILEPRRPRFLLALTGGLAQLHGQLQCAYGPRIMTIGVTSQDESFWLPDPETPTRYSTRDLAAEQAARGRLRAAGFTGPDAQGRWQLLGQNAVLSFLAREFPRLEREWTVTLEERLERSCAQNLERVEPTFQVTPSGQQWFDLDVSFTSRSGERFPAAEIQRLILSGQSHTRLKNGRIALIDTGAVEELQEVLLDCAPQQHENGYRMNNTQAAFLDASLRQQGNWTVQAPAAWRERAAQQSGTARLETPPLGDLEDVLRPYQKQGVAWLRFLRDNQFGGILADEMGLGKTLQALAFLRAVPMAGAAADRRPSLVVCPTSLVFNWVAEARRFTPQLKVLAWHGARRRELGEPISSADLVVTSYALIRRDADVFRGVEWDTVVLDEAQHIKNRQTQNAQAVKAIRARHRLVLTGTPLENSVLDLWSIMDFLMPGYLGTAQDFRERYELPIAREKNSEAQGRLARRVRPFLLRRLKREVAPELPAKIEQVSLCELTDDQRAVYQQVLEASRREVLDAVGAQGLAKSRMIVLNALLRLRQICCDLRLLKLEHLNPETTSGKLDLFDELLEEVLDGGHRVLVFSQFVSMLTLLRERLTAAEVAHCYLDGATVHRGEVVNRFQTDATIPVFLISLKAGGVGLNLTGADTVVHFDPWWNPAIEDQATDRAHRIGQTRVVTSYKLITRGTVEEKIVQLQARKRELIQGVLSGEEDLTNALTWEEIQDLFA